jgi:hypothetical protein
MKELFQKLAQATHTLAGGMVDPEAKRLLLEIAVSYDRLAELTQPASPSPRVAFRRRQKTPRHYH